MVGNPQQASFGYTRLLDAEPRPIPEGLAVETGSAPIALASRARLAKRLAGVTPPARPEPVVAALFIRVADRNRAATALRRGGFTPTLLKDGSLAIGADQAHGVAVLFG
jgi:hypothetical protein